jgi:phosphoesterase RecJ-like protein
MIEAGVLHALHEHQNILCMSHVSPDGDAYGSLLGIGWILRHLGKQPVLAMHDKTPSEFMSMSGSTAILAPAEVGNDYDLVIVLDTSSLDRVGAVYHQEWQGQIPLLVIDHHITNLRFGDINWVAPECVATCQMLVELADALAVPLTGKLAEYLLTGIVTDTLCFRTSNTTSTVLEVAARLMRGGGDLVHITQHLLNQRSYALFKLWGLVLSHVELEDGVIWTTISRDEMSRAGDQNHDAQLSSTLITAIEADISATFTERLDDQGRQVVDCSFRARPGFNIAATALALGGGGHPAAGGCTLPGGLAEATRRVVPMLQAARREQAAKSGARA